MEETEMLKIKTHKNYEL